MLLLAEFTKFYETMVRKLKHHEQKLLKKTSFFEWESDHGHQAEKIIKRYALKNRNEYVTYNKISREAVTIAKKLRDLEPDDQFRIKATAQLLDKLYQCGFIKKTSNLEDVLRLSASKICQRRIPVVMVSMNMAQSVSVASNMVKEGHVRLGPELISDPATLVTRKMEDFLTWRDTSKINVHRANFHNVRDDFEMTNC